MSKGQYGKREFIGVKKALIQVERYKTVRLHLSNFICDPDFFKVKTNVAFISSIEALLGRAKFWSDTVETMTVEWNRVDAYAFYRLEENLNELSNAIAKYIGKLDKKMARTGIRQSSP